MTTTSTSDGCGCGCCAGVGDQTPQRIVNRPGLREIGYRAGTYAQFRQSMIAGLTRSDRPALADLRTRDAGDLTMALIDAWAVTADVLTFYTERAANENYLGPATERRSVAGLVGLIGYRLGAGVAAQTTLAFSLDTSPGSPTTVPIATGAKVATLPGPGELPQTYETVEDLIAVADWNSLLVRQTLPRTPRDGDTTILLVGAATGVLRGDTLLLIGDGATAGTGFMTARVTEVVVDALRQRTTVAYGFAVGSLEGAADVRAYVLRQRAALFGFNAASPLLFAADVKTALGAQLESDDSEWSFAALTPSAVDLDALYEGVTTGSPVLLRVGDATVLAGIEGVRETGRTAYGISAKVTRLALDRTADELAAFGEGSTRETTVLLRADELTLADVPVTAPVFGATIELDTPVAVPELLPRPVLLRGRPARVRTAPEAEVFMDRDDGAQVLTTDADLVVRSIDAQPGDPSSWIVRVVDVDGVLGTIITAAANLVFLPPHPEDPVVGETALVEAVMGSVLLLAEPLTSVYHHEVELWGNVVTGTHGESVVDEVLGSGDAGRAYQRFTLRRAPLTQTQAATPSGAASTLRVFVNDVEWAEVPSLYGQGPRDRVFATATTDDGRTEVLFGDGVSGARPPTGTDNVRARYRSGTGLAGLAAVDQLSLLMTRPLGVRSVRNPFAATGAQDPQVGADAADNAPRTVLTLGRVVSLRDYADFASAVGGIGKAAATWTWDGVVRGVALTVAGVGGAAITPRGPLMDNLTAAVLTAGNRRVPLVIRPAEIGLFALKATLVLDPAYLPEPVLDAARAAIADHFSFARRDFGQVVSLGEVDQVLHAVRGVAGVLVERLHRSGELEIRHSLLAARALVPGAPPPAEGAEVLTVDLDRLDLGVAP